MERRVILIGKTGNGKSSTANSILAYSAFVTDLSSDSVTLNCAVRNSNRYDGRVFTVCDTPGLFCAGEDPIEMALKVQQSVEICPQPHVFLLVFSAARRFTRDEKYTIDLLRIIFGDKMFDHCIVVITRGNDLKSESKFEQFCTRHDEMKKIVKKCGNRVVRIENDTDFPSNSELGGLLERIEQLAKKGSYGNNFLKTHAEVLKEYKQTYGVIKSEDIDTHIHKVLNLVEKRVEQKEKRLGEEIERKRKEDERRLAIERQMMYEEMRRINQEERTRFEKERQILSEENRKLKEKLRQLYEETEKQGK